MTFNFSFNEIPATIIAAALGAIGTPFITKFLSRRSEQSSDAAHIRDELRKDNDSLQKENIMVSDEAHKWQEKYWEQVEKNITLRRELEEIKTKINTNIAIRTEEDKQTITVVNTLPTNTDK